MVGSSLTEDAPDRPPPTPTAAQCAPSAIETAIESAATTPETPTSATQSKGGTSQRERTKDDSQLHNFDVLASGEQEYIATQNNPELPDNGLAVGKRPHGRALPK
jgi:hypothetical protein